MHELSIAMAIVDEAQKIAQRENATKVCSLVLSIGKISGVDAESLQLCFPLAAENSVLEGAKLQIESPGIQLRCPECTGSFSSDEFSLVCPACGADGCELIGGREILITSMELEKNV